MKPHHHVFLTLILLAVSFGAITVLSAREVRVWTDRTGKFEVKASLHRIRDNRVTLKKTDGKYLTIEVGKLADKDREYLAELEEKEAEENPFAGGSDIDEEAEEVLKFKDDGRDLFFAAPKPVNRESVIAGGGAADFRWICPADAGKTRKFEGRIRSVPFVIDSLPFGVWADKTDFFVFSQNGKPMVLNAVTIDMNNKGDGRNKTRVYLGDVSAGKCVYVDYPQKVHPLDVSPDGKWALFREEKWGFANRWKKGLHVVRIEGNSLKKHVAYMPFSETAKTARDDDHDAEIDSARWIDGKHALIRSKRGKFILLDVESGRGLWTIDGSLTTGFFLSPGKRQCIIAASSGPMLIDSLGGEAIGKFEIADKPGNGLFYFGFSPDGKKIAARCGENVYLWNATDGEPQPPFYVGPIAGYHVHWPDNRFVLIGNRLIDTENRALVWTYNMPGKFMFSGGFFWYTEGRGKKDSHLCSVVIPHPKALKAAEAPEEERFCILPGMEVAIETDDSVKEDREEIVESLEKQLTANGLVVKPDAEITVLLKVTKESQSTVMYQVGTRFVPPSPLFSANKGTEVKYAGHRFSIEFRQEDETLCDFSRATSPPDHISLDEIRKTSLQGAVNKAMSKVDYKKEFQEIRIPQKVPHPDFKGISRLNENGIIDLM